MCIFYFWCVKFNSKWLLERDRDHVKKAERMARPLVTVEPKKVSQVLEKKYSICTVCTICSLRSACSRFWVTFEFMSSFFIFFGGPPPKCPWFRCHCCIVKHVGRAVDRNADLSQVSEDVFFWICGAHSIRLYEQEEDAFHWPSLGVDFDVQPCASFV